MKTKMIAWSYLFIYNMLLSILSIQEEKCPSTQSPGCLRSSENSCFTMSRAWHGKGRAHPSPTDE